jgi:hypothetical protein
MVKWTKEPKRLPRSGLNFGGKIFQYLCWKTPQIGSLAASPYPCHRLAAGLEDFVHGDAVEDGVFGKAAFER